MWPGRPLSVGSGIQGWGPSWPMRLSVPASIVAPVDSDDVVDPADAELHKLMGQLADNAHDERRRDRIIGLMLTLPPSREWSPEALEQCRATYEYVRGLRRDLEQRQLDEMYKPHW
jgi:hypothetical protein